MVAYITVEGIGRVQKAMTGYARRIPKAGRRGVWLFANHLSKALRMTAKARGHKTTGYLSSEKGTHPRKLDKDTWAIMMPYYTHYLEKGTKRHWIPRMYKTQLWARKHGMSFAMMRAGISGQGTKPHPFTAFVINRETKNLKREVEKQINDAIKKGG